MNLLTLTYIVYFVLQNCHTLHRCLFTPRENEVSPAILAPLVPRDPEERWDTQAFLERREKLATGESMGRRVIPESQDPLEKLSVITRISFAPIAVY